MKLICLRLVDDSINEAFQLTFSRAEPVITRSFGLRSPMDWKNEFEADPAFINFLADGFEKNDQVLIISAGNEGNNISECLEKGLKLYEEGNDPRMSPIERDYSKHKASVNLTKKIFKQFAEHPILRKRVLIAINAQVCSDKIENRVTFLNGMNASAILGLCTHYPIVSLLFFSLKKD